MQKQQNELDIRVCLQVRMHSGV